MRPRMISSHTRVAPWFWRDEHSAPEIHALAHWINAQLDGPLDFIEPFDRSSAHEPSTFAALADDLDAGRVETLVILDANVGYDAPAELSIARGVG